MNAQPIVETEIIDRLFLELSQVTRARTNRDMDFEFALREANEVCRSMHAIVDRKGKETNWGSFKKILDDALENQADILLKHGENK